MNSLNPENSDVQFGYSPLGVDRLLELYNKTELKRNNGPKVNQAFQNSQVVATRAPYLDWENVPESK